MIRRRQAHKTVASYAAATNQTERVVREQIAAAVFANRISTRPVQTDDHRLMKYVDVRNPTPAQIKAANLDERDLADLKAGTLWIVHDLYRGTYGPACGLLM